MTLFYKESKMVLHRLFRIKRLSVSASGGGFRFYNEMAELKLKYPQFFALNNLNYPEYPPIADMSEEGQKKHYRKMWYDSIKSLPSVEEKLFELATQQRLDHKTYTLSIAPPLYNGVHYYNYITRTHVINNLPKQYTDMNVNQELAEIRESLCETLLNYYYNIWKDEKYKSIRDYFDETNAGSKLINSLILQCYKKLSCRNDYVTNSTIQQNPRIWSFWWHGGYGSDNDEIDERNPCFQFEDFGTFSIRVKEPLLPIVDMNDSLCTTAEVDNYHYHPEVFQFPCETKKIASVPGYWPGDPHEFPFLLVLTSDKLKGLTSQLQYFEKKKLETSAAVISSFAWLNAIATYQGFTPFNDVTYPIVSQTIITNGQDWNFFVYQLNTVAFHDDVDKKDRRNLCWTSGKLRLFDSIEDGRVKGINEEVFMVLLKFLHSVPQVKENVVLKPYLGIDTRADHEKLHLRYLLRKAYSRIPEKMAHRDEIPAWVKVYKLHPDAPPTPFIKLE